MKTNVLELNLPQFTAIEATRHKVYNPELKKMDYIKTIILEWARGTGKSTIIGWFIKECVIQMPKSTGILVCETYMQALSRTLPSTKEGLAMVGLFEGSDYVVGRCGASLGYEMPFQAPSRWDNVIHFSNGTIMIMVSLDMQNAGRGINSSWVVGDEAALLDKERLFNNVQTTNRSTCGGLYEDKPLCNAEIYASSVAMTQKGQWFTDMQLLAKKKPYKVVFIQADALANRHNLSRDWFIRMRDNAVSKMHFLAEIMNVRPKKVAMGFYPALDPKKHYYRDTYDHDYLNSIGIKAAKQDFNCKQDIDLMRNKNLIMTIDWGNIITMTISQDQGERYRNLKTFYVENPKIIDDLIDEEFAPYYEDKKRANNVIEFYQDRNGNNKQPNSRFTYAEQAIAALKRNGWKVIVKVRKGMENPGHNEKYLVVNYLLRYGGTQGLPVVEINENNCANLIVSLENAPALEGKQPNTVVKDKSSEKSKTLPQEHATHFSDTFDIPIYHRYRKQVERLMSIRGDRGFIPMFKGHQMVKA